MQGTGVGAVHMPEPLQEDAAMLDLPSMLHVAAAHISPTWV